MTELPCPACHGEMVADWGGHRAQCTCGAEIHMSGGWLWPSFEVPLKPLMPDATGAPPPGWRVDGSGVQLDRSGLFRRWLGHPTEVALDGSALTVRRWPGRLRRGEPFEARVPSAMIQLFVPVLFDLFFQGIQGGSRSSAAVPVEVSGARIATHKFGVFAVTREPVVDVDEDVPRWLQGRVLTLGIEWTQPRARSAVAHLNATRLRLAGGYRR